jgi:hypothetical protein
MTNKNEIKCCPFCGGDIAACSVGRETINFLTPQKTSISYYYRTPDGALFATIANSIDEAREKRGEWLMERSEIKKEIGEWLSGKPICIKGKKHEKENGCNDNC